MGSVPGIRDAVAIALCGLLVPVVVSAAQSALSGAPTRPGAGGIACACVNLGSATVGLDVEITSGVSGTSQSCPALTTGQPCTVSQTPALDPTNAYQCQVTRLDSGSVLARKIHCALTPLDGNGNPTVVIPIDAPFQTP